MSYINIYSYINEVMNQGKYLIKSGHNREYSMSVFSVLKNSGVLNRMKENSFLYF